MRTLCALVTVLLIAGPVLAGGHHADPPLAFSPVPDYGAPLATVVPPWRVHDGRPMVSEVLHAPDTPDPAPKRAHADAVVARGLSHDAGRSVSGVASWYCCTRGRPSGLYAAAGPSLRVGRWRGRTVLVSAGGRQVRVILIDYCACPKRLVDLYPAAFSRLAPISHGLVKVEVTW